MRLAITSTYNSFCGLRVLVSGLLLTLLMSQHAFARQRSIAITSAHNLKFERLSIEHGLSQNSVNCIMQDHRGFLWIGTDRGLNKFDAYRFTVYKHDPEDSQSLRDGKIWCLFEDRAGNLWIGTDDGGLSRFNRDTETFAHFRHDPKVEKSLSSNHVRTIFEDRSGTLWIGTSNGLNRFDRDENRFTLFVNNLDHSDHLSRNRITAIYEDSHNGGTLWIGTAGGLFQLRRDHSAQEQFRFIAVEAANADRAPAIP